MSQIGISTLDKALRWARAQSLGYITSGGGCCADEVLNALGPRYDLERFGCVPEQDPRRADLLIVNGAVSKKAAPHLRQVYDAMLAPKYVLAIGACATCGGMFGQEHSYSTLGGVGEIIPVDIYIPGCPPRPEAIMNGLIALQEKIRGIQRDSLRA